MRIVQTRTASSIEFVKVWTNSGELANQEVIDMYINSNKHDTSLLKIEASVLDKDYDGNGHPYYSLRVERTYR